MINKLFSLGLLGSIMMSGVAYAHDAGDIIIRNGLVSVQPMDSSNDLYIAAPELGGISNGKVSVDSDTQIGLSLTYMISSQLGIELLAATPFSHDINGSGALAGAGKLADTKQLPPTLSVQYYFLEPSSALQPYAGIGINYTNFFQESTTSTLTNSIGALAAMKGAAGVTATSTALKLDDSIGMAAQVGVDYKMTENMGLNAAVWYADIATSGTIIADTNVGEVRANIDVDVNPMVYMVGAYIKF
ncbi:MAG: outer membrane beta-barrel protein [Hahellaceae bacterium]|nr:outer membrane beta-barrel protein [Hahellaceae bacterium]MCP5168858.1 outer membrane beta-barrel protein [Hahellaceae bacterium]